MVFYSIAIFYLTVGAVFGCNPGWSLVGDDCFISPEEQYDFRLARRYCEIYLSDLANFTTSLEWFLINNVKLSAAEFWIGEESSESTTVATEGSTVESRNDVDYCPMVSNARLPLNTTVQNRGKELCSTKLRFICSAPENMDYTCLQGQFLFGQKCYELLETPTYAQDLMQRCFRLHEQGYMAVVNDPTELAEVHAVVTGRSGTVFCPANSTGCLAEGNCLVGKTVQPLVVEWESVNCHAEPQFFICEWDAWKRNVTMDVTTVNYPGVTTGPADVTTGAAPVTTVAPLLCPVGYNWKLHEYSGYCFWETTYETEKLNWFQARRFCQAYGGDLATYSDVNQETHGLGGALGHYKGLWFGLQRGEDDVFRWVDGSELNYTNWKIAEPNLSSSSKYCAVHAAATSKWELDYCGVRRWFICKAPKTKNPRIPETDFTKTPCNVTGISTYRNQWYKFGDHCYLAPDDYRGSWYMASTFCKDNGGELASVHSSEETNFILLLGSLSSATRYWIGLSSLGVDDSYSWSDGTPMNFFYWEDGYSTEKNDEAFKCVTFDYLRGFWRPDLCNTFLRAVCKRKFNSTNEATVTRAPEVDLPGNCEKDWYQRGNKCYKIFGKKWTQRLSWMDANDTCRRLGGSLVSVHSENEQDFLATLQLEAYGDVWIGLKSYQQGSLFHWVDSSPVDYTNWYSGHYSYSEEAEPDSDEDSSSTAFRCITMTFNHHGTGRWETRKYCKTKLAYICQKYKDPELVNPPEDPFQCSNITGWSRLSSSCYGIFETPGNWSTWLEAQTVCRSYGANLVAMNTLGSRLFLKKQLNQSEGQFWIGVVKKTNSTFSNINGVPLQLSNWLSGQPREVSSLVSDNCVAVNTDTKWMVRNCNERRPFICEWTSTSAEDRLETFIEKSSYCPNSTDWVDLGGESCYFYDSNRTPWTKAMHYCFEHGGSLASFHSETEMQLVKRYLSTYTSSTLMVHIGLAKKRDGSLGWVDQSPLDFSLLDAADTAPVTPPYREEPRNCFQLDVLNGFWTPISCHYETSGFICSVSIRDSNTQIIENIEKDSQNASMSAGGITAIVITVLLFIAIGGAAIYYFYPLYKKEVPIVRDESL